MYKGFKDKKISLLPQMNWSVINTSAIASDSFPTIRHCAPYNLFIIHQGHTVATYCSLITCYCWPFTWKSIKIFWQLGF